MPFEGKAFKEREEGEAAKSLSFFHRKGEEERPQPAPGLAPGKVVGDFRLVSLIGQGGMGQVWEAQQVSLGKRHVAVKFVRPERVTERQLELFAREARAGGRLHHRGIVTVHGYGQSEGLAWIAMEFVSGAWTLRDFLDEVARADEVPEGYDRHVARFVAEVAEAMHAAHEAGVIHRDLKPQNVLIAPDEHPKVTDFGLARITDESAMSQTGDFAGTYFYMSPEQVTARRMGLDHRTDIFSLGIVLYEMLALQRPFQGDTSHQVAAQIVTKDPPDARSIRSKVPRDLAVIANHALEKDRDKRYQTMKELAADLRRFLADEPILAQPPTRRDRAVKWVKRNPAKSSVAAVVALALVMITGLLVENVRARARAEENARIAGANERRALAGEELARQNEQRALTGEALAKEEKARADAEAEEARRKADEVLRLSALQKLDDLTAEADRLFPAVPENISKYEDWLRKAGALVAELPDHERKLAELRARSVPWPEEEQAKLRAEHPRLAELETAQRQLEHHRLLRTALEWGEPLQDPTPAEVSVDLASLPTTAIDVNNLAWDLIDPDRKDWGGEAQGLVLARRAVELVSELSPAERARVGDTLAWALFANGRFDEAVAEEEKALEEAAADSKDEFQSYLDRLRKKIEEEIDPAMEPEREKHLVELEQRIAELEAEISKHPEWVFADAQDKWWHNQLERLVNGLKTLSDPEMGLASASISAEHGWGIEKRAEFARAIAERSLNGRGASTKWAEALASLANPADCPQYAGLRISPQLGLLPIGRDPDSGMWEFAHLQTGDPADRGPDGKLILKDATGLVFVLLPGGTFTMGAQRDDPSGPNYDPQARRSEGPPFDMTLGPFFLSKYEMTQGQWLRFTGKNPSRDAGWNPEGEPRYLLHPVEQVSFDDCAAVLGRLGLELPGEAYWEYGARAGTTTVWWCGDEKESTATAGNLNESWDDGNNMHARVGSYEPNAFGLYDVIGNVQEWCDTTGYPYRFSRGGGYVSDAEGARSAHRSNHSAADGDGHRGLRPARPLLAP